MSRRANNQTSKWKRGIYAGLLLCLFSGSGSAQDATLSAASLLSSEPQQLDLESGLRPFPILLQNHGAGLAFDLAGSETRKLQFQIAEPLSLKTVAGSRWLNTGGGSILAGTSLQWMATENLGFNAGVEHAESSIQMFQQVGSIHCQNGILDASSYRASDCYFTNRTDELNLGKVSIGVDYNLGNNAAAAISLVRQESTIDFRNAGQAGSSAGIALMNAGLPGPVFGSSLAPNATGVQYLETEVTGIDLAFKVGLSTDVAGDMQMGLQFTHVLDGSSRGLFPSGNGLNEWTVAESFDSATVSFDWQRNSFSGGIQGFYREPVEFLNRPNLESIATFDVYFTWRTPWNGSLSVGASNLLNSGVDETKTNEKTVSDPFESIYGRIPYVRYKQDL